VYAPENVRDHIKIKVFIPNTAAGASESEKKLQMLFPSRNSFATKILPANINAVAV
jgi:hypothetical protein